MQRWEKGKRETAKDEGWGVNTADGKNEGKNILLKTKKEI